MDLLLQPRSKVKVTDANVEVIFKLTYSTRIATASGVVPPFLQYQDYDCKKTVQPVLAPELLTMFELQKFLNRLHTAMSAQVASHNGVSEAVVRSWEDEFELLKPLVTRVESGMNTSFSQPRMQLTLRL